MENRWFDLDQNDDNHLNMLDNTGMMGLYGGGYGINSIPSDNSNGLLNHNYITSSPNHHNYMFVPQQGYPNQSLQQPLHGGHEICGNCESKYATAACLQCNPGCEFLCNNCATKHNEMKSLRNHEVVSLDIYHSIRQQKHINIHMNNSMMHMHPNLMDNNDNLFFESISRQSPPGHSPIRGSESLLMQETIDKSVIGVIDCTDDEFSSLARGENNSVIAKVMSRTGCEVFNSSSPLGKQVIVRGGQHQVEHAKSMLKDYFMSQEPLGNLHLLNPNQHAAIPSNLFNDISTASLLNTRRTSKLITIPKDKIEYVYGSHGLQINEIMNSTGATIQIKNEALSQLENAAGMMCLEVSGNSMDVDKAMEYIQAILQRGSVTGLINPLILQDKINSSSILYNSTASNSNTPITQSGVSNSGAMFNASFSNAWSEGGTSVLFSTVVASGNGQQPPVAASPLTTTVAATITNQSTPIKSVVNIPVASDTATGPEIVSYMDCPHDKVKLVIGAKGVIIKNIMKRSKTTIIIDEKFPEGHPRKVEIRGKADHILVAKQLIACVIEHGPTILDEDKSGATASIEGRVKSGTVLSSATKSRSPDQLSGEIVSILCPADKISIVIGAKGVIINEISRRSNAQISIDEDPRNSIAETAKALLSETINSSDSNELSDLRRIEIRGTLEEIEVAKGLIESVVANGPNVLYAADAIKVNDELKIPTAVKKSLEIACPKDKVGALIGSKGIIIKEIMKKSNTQISVAEEVIQHDFSPIHGGVSPNFIDSRMVTIRGFPDDIEVCRALIEEIIGSDVNSPETKSPRSLSNSGSDVASSMSQSMNGSPAIQSNRTNSSNPKLPGSFPSWSSQNDAVETLSVPLERMRDIIGIKGAVIKKISTQSGAKITVDNDLPPNAPRILELRGTVEQVESAKDMLLTILENPSRKSNSNDMDYSPVSYLKSFDDEILSKGLNPNVQIVHNIDFASTSAVSVINSRKQLLDKIVFFSGTTINMKSVDKESVTLRLVVEGFPDAVQDATGLIHKLFFDIIAPPGSYVKNAASYMLQSEEEIVCDVLDCPSNKTWLLIGHRGTNIKEIMRKTNATISVMKTKYSTPLVADSPVRIEPIDPTGSPTTIRRVVIIGTKISITSAKAMLVTLINDYKDDDMKDGKMNRRGIYDDDDEDDDEDDDDEDDDIPGKKSSNYMTSSYDDDDDDGDDIQHCSIECPDDKVGLVIGFKGVVIKSMKKISKADIVVIGAVINGKQTRIVEIKGTEAQVQAAKKLVECVITHGSDALDLSGDASLALGIITKTIDLTLDSIKILTNEFGPSLKLVSQRTLASISILPPKKATADGNIKCVTVKGTLAYVNNAMGIIQECMDNNGIQVIGKSSKYEDEDEDSGSTSNSPGSPVHVSSSSNNDWSSGSFSYIAALEGDKNISSGSVVKTKVSQPTNSIIETDGDDDSKGSLKGGIKSPQTTKVIACPVSRVGTLIGTRGVIVKEIMKRSGAIIVVNEASVPDPTNPSQQIREVQIKGSRSSVLSAEKIIRGLIEHGTRVLSKGYEV